MKFNKYHFELETVYEEKLPCGIKEWQDHGSVVLDRIQILKWREEFYPFSNNPTDNELIVGYIGFYDDDPTVVQYAYLKRKYRGTGIGRFLYKWVMKDNGKLSSHYNATSIHAKNMWSKLTDTYRSRCVATRGKGTYITVYPHKKKLKARGNWFKAHNLEVE